MRAQGSGTWPEPVAGQLLEAGAVTMTRLEETSPLVAFLAGKLDALVFASTPGIADGADAAANPGVQLLYCTARSTRGGLSSPGHPAPGWQVDLASNA